MEYKSTLNLPKTDFPIRANSAKVEEECLKLWEEEDIYHKLLKNTEHAVPAGRQGAQNTGRWEIYTHGGRTPTGMDAVEWATRGWELGAGEILLTSMDRDGTKDGYDLELTSAISSAVNIPVIASGGAGTLEHIYDAFVEGGAEAALLASLLHYRELTIKQIKDYLQTKGINVRA